MDSLASSKLLSRPLSSGLAASPSCQDQSLLDIPRAANNKGKGT